MHLWKQGEPGTMWGDKVSIPEPARVQSPPARRSPLLDFLAAVAVIIVVPMLFVCALIPVTFNRFSRTFFLLAGIHVALLWSRWMRSRSRGRF